MFLRILVCIHFLLSLWGCVDGSDSTQKAFSSAIALPDGTFQVTCLDGSQEIVSPASLGLACSPKPHKTYKKVVGSANDVFCVINQDDEIECSGLTPGDSNARVNDIPPYLGKVKDLVMSNDLSCAILLTEELKCWGRSHTQALEKSGNYGLLPKKVKAVAVSDSQICVRSQSDEILCSGKPSLSATSFTSVFEKASELSGGEGGICGLFEDYPSTKCWGVFNNTLNMGISARAVAGSSRINCILDSHNNALCAGYEERSLPSSKTFDSLPTSIAVFDFDYASTGSSNSTACVTFSNAAPICWGSNSKGQSILPADLGILKSITIGQNYACGLDVNDGVKCWRHGSSKSQPFQVLGSRASVVFAGGNSTCAMGEYPDGSMPALKCWGASLGLDSTYYPYGYTEDKSETIMIGDGRLCVAPLGGSAFCYGGNSETQDWNSIELDRSNLISIAGGDLFTCGVKEGGDMVCWGEYQRGSSALKDKWSNVKTIAAGSKHVCALGQSGDIKCFGDNSRGQLNASSAESAQAITSSADFTCAILNRDNRLQCWGAVPPSIPLEIADLTSISAGSDHLCATRGGSELICWGAQNSRILEYPRDLGAVRNLVSGFSHACAIQVSSSRLVCWGGNANGQSHTPQILPSSQRAYSDVLQKNRYETSSLLHDNILDCDYTPARFGDEPDCFLPTLAFYSFRGLRYNDAEGQSRDLQYKLSLEVDVQCNAIEQGFIQLKVVDSYGEVYNLSSGTNYLSFDARGSLNLYVRAGSHFYPQSSWTSGLPRGYCNVAVPQKARIVPESMKASGNPGINEMIYDAATFAQKLKDYVGFTEALYSLKVNGQHSQEKLLQDLNYNLNEAAQISLEILLQNQARLEIIWPGGNVPELSAQGIINDISESDPYFDDSLSIPRRKLRAVKQSKIRSLMSNLSSLSKLCSEPVDVDCIDMLNARRNTFDIAINNVNRFHAATSDKVPNPGSDVEKTYKKYKKELDGLMVSAQEFMEMTDFIRASVEAHATAILVSIEQLQNSFSNCSRDVCDGRGEQ